MSKFSFPLGERIVMQGPCLIGHEVLILPHQSLHGIRKEA
jgi:hypothetical protein